MIESLTKLREEWDAAANGESLLHTEGSVGLILYDLAVKLDLTILERQQLLGNSLFDELAAFMSLQTR
jgi:hypothetical protein